MISRDAVNIWIAVYMMSNRRHGTVYTGVTSFLSGRIGQHKARATKRFTREYGLSRLVWYETHELMTVDPAREEHQEISA